MRTIARSMRTATLLIFMLSGLLLVSCQQSASDSVDIDVRKKLAGELRDSKLYTAAIEEYKQVLESNTLDSTQRGSINYLIGRVYFSDLKDYENAAAYFVRARTYDPNGSYMQEASRSLVASLEKMGHIVDASRELGAATDIDAAPRAAGDLPVAVISGDTVWRSELEIRIQSLPADAQKQLLTETARSEFLRQYVGMELLYRAAVREGFDRDPEVIRNRDMLLRQMLVEKFVTGKVMPEVRIDTLDVRNFYLAGKESRYDNKPYDSVKAEVFLGYQSEKANAAYTDYISRLASAEKVVFLDRNLSK